MDKKTQKPQKQEAKKPEKKDFFEKTIENVEALRAQIEQKLSEVQAKYDKYAQDILNIMNNYNAVLAEYKDKLKDLMGLHMIVMSKTVFNQYLDYDYNVRLGELIEALPPQALAEGIKLFQTGYLAGKYAGLDLKSMDLSQIMSLGQDPELVTKMPDKMLETLNVLNQYIPTIYSTELEKYKNQLASLQFLYERLKDELAYLRVYIDELKSIAQFLNIKLKEELLPFLILEKLKRAEYTGEKIKELKKKNEQKSTNILDELWKQYQPKGSSPQTGGIPSYLQPKQPPEKNTQNKDNPTNLWGVIKHPGGAQPLYK